MSAKYNGSSEMCVGQPMAVGRRQLRRDTKGRFAKRRLVTTHSSQEGTNGGNMVPFSAASENVATNDDEENIGKVAYDSILNLESPDPTTLLRIMMGNRYSTDEVSEQFQNVARLQAAEFTTLLTIMNNAGYDETTDDGHYDVYKVMTNLEGW